MLNRFLPQNELESVFSNAQMHELDLILDAVDTDKQTKIIQNEKLLGELHHAMNLNNYSKNSFRLKLLKYAPKISVLKFAKKIYLKRSLSDITDNQYRKLVSDLSKLPWGDNAYTKMFLNEFNYPNFLIPHSNKKFVNKEIIKSSINYLPILKEYQSKIFYDMIKQLETPNYRALIQMPTGSGKTRTAMEIACHFLNNDRDYQVVWLAESQELLDQASTSFKKIWSQKGVRDIQIYKIWGNEKIPKITSKNCLIVMGYAKYNGLLKRGNSLSIQPDLVIVDEAHQILAKVYNELLGTLTDFLKGTRVIGLTATPGRGTSAKKNLKLADQFNGNIVRINIPSNESQNIDDDNVVEYLEDRGILSKIEPKPLITNIKFNLTNNVWKKFVKMIEAQYPDFKESDLNSLAKNVYRNALIVQRLRDLLKEKKRILYFGTTSHQTLLMYAIIRKLGYNAGYVDANTNKEFRAQFVEDFRNGEIDIIFNHSVFTTGFDAPETNVFIARPVCSSLLHVQSARRY